MSGRHSRVKDVGVFSALVVTGALLLFVTLSGKGLPGLSYALTVGIVGGVVASAYLAGLGYIFGWPTGYWGRIKGVRWVAEKSAVGRDTWFGLVSEAEREFYVAGHSMGLWCSPSNGEEFIEEVWRIVRGGGTVTLVMLGPKSEPLQRLGLATGVDYNTRVEESLEVLGALARSLDPDERPRFRVRVLRDHLSVPYMVVGNEKRLITASYMAMSKNEASLCLELERDNRSAVAIYDDFHKLAREGESAQATGGGRKEGAAPLDPDRTQAAKSQASPDGRTRWALRRLGRRG